MIHRVLTNCRQKLIHLWARLHTDATINEVIPLNRAELCESVVFLHSQSSLSVLMMIHRLRLLKNCRQKLFHLWARLHTEATINELIPQIDKIINIQWNQIVGFHPFLLPAILVFDKKKISFLPHFYISCQVTLAAKCTFLPRSKYSDYVHEWFTDCRRIADEN